MKILLKTFALLEDGCFSTLETEGEDLVCYTIERVYPELGGKPKIPNGEHHCHRAFYHHGGYPVFEVEVEGHADIYIHKANVQGELDGCIATGLARATFNLNAAGHAAKPDEEVVGTGNGVSGSGAAFDIFMALVKDVEEFVLEVSGR